MYELTGWDLLALLGTAFAVGVVFGAKLTADTLREGYHLLVPDPPQVNDPPEGDGPPVDLPPDRPRRPPPGRGTDVFPQAATKDEPWRPSILPHPDAVPVWVRRLRDDNPEDPDRG